MIELLKETETQPATYPAVPQSLLDMFGNGDDLSAFWTRIESYVDHRWTPRPVVWVVSGPGDWQPPLSPATVLLVECWTGSTWETVSLDASPLDGFTLPRQGQYRFAADVGGGTVPPAVERALARLVLYCTHDLKHPELLSATSVSETDGDIQNGYTRPVAWIPRAMQLSGAADLLRPYRRLK